jgi:sugar/nucleoside kinase (ribokinase family)
MLDLISIGDARVDNYYFVDEATLLCRHNQEVCELCFQYGDKVPVSQYRQLVAGNNANNAVGVARLGLKTALYGHVGADATGNHIIQTLKKEKVDTRYIQQIEGMDTENSAVIAFKGERTILVFHQPWEYNLPDLDRAKWVYFSSVAATFSKSQLVRQIESYMERTGAKLVVAPGTHVMKYGLKKFPRLLSLTEVLIVNLEEAKEILGIAVDKHVEVKKLLDQLSHLGPKMVIVTDGRDGSYGFDGKHHFKLAIFPSKLLETTGSGDAYATGVVAGLFYGQDLSEAMRWGTANAASVVEQIGPQAGLLTREQIKERLKANAETVVKELK